jgi:hypothetical protein
MRDLTGVSWSRLSASERVGGKYGNALRYAQKAVAISSEEGPDWGRNQAHNALYALHVWLRTDEREEYAREMARRMKTATGHNERAFYKYWLACDLSQQERNVDALKALRRSRNHFELAGYKNNAIWAALREARIYLDMRDRDGVARTMHWIEERIESDDPASILLEWRIVVLRRDYLWRRSWSEVASTVKRCESYLDREPETSLRLELLQVLFRLYARRGLLMDAERLFRRYRDLVLDVIANVDPRYAEGLTKAVGLDQMLSEVQRVGRATGEGKKRGPYDE